MSDPQNIEAAAAQWIRRREFGDWNDAVEQEFQAWINQTVLHRVAYLRLEEGWLRTERLAALKLPEFNRPSSPAARSTRRWITFGRAAVALVTIAILGATAKTYFQKAADDTYSTPVGGREILTMFDGSHVELNTDTVLKLGKERRTATLVKGEAFFQIKHNASNPFVITANGHRITDLGTKFSVRDTGGTLRVSLLEGSAKIEKANGSRALVLKPGDVALATADTLKIVKKPVQILANDTGWRRGVVIFRHMALADAAVEFNRYNLKQLAVDPKVAGITIDGTFATDNLETFAHIVHIALGLRVESHEREIVITR